MTTEIFHVTRHVSFVESVKKSKIFIELKVWYTFTRNIWALKFLVYYSLYYLSGYLEKWIFVTMSPSSCSWIAFNLRTTSFSMSKKIVHFFKKYCIGLFKNSGENVLLQSAVPKFNRSWKMELKTWENSCNRVLFE